LAQLVRLTPEEVYLISEAIADGDEVIRAFMKMIKSEDTENLAWLRCAEKESSVRYLQGALKFTGRLLSFFDQVKFIEKQEDEE
jgi:hypothetical protein